MGGVPFVGVKNGESGYGFLGTGINLDRGLQLAFGLLQIVIQPVKTAEKQVVVKIVRFDFDDLLVLLNSQLEHIVRAVAAGHVTERTQINAAEKLMRFKIVGIALDDILRFNHGVADAARLYVKFGQAGGQKFRRGVGLDSEAVFFNRLVRQFAAAVGGHFFFVHMREHVVVIGCAVIGFTRGGWRRGRFRVGYLRISSRFGVGRRGRVGLSNRGDA